jgi:hypothetical protein
MGVRLYRFYTRPDVPEIAREDLLCRNALQCSNGTERLHWCLDISLVDRDRILPDASWQDRTILVRNELVSEIQEMIVKDTIDLVILKFFNPIPRGGCLTAAILAKRSRIMYDRRSKQRGFHNLVQCISFLR